MNSLRRISSAGAIMIVLFTGLSGMLLVTTGCPPMVDDNMNGNANNNDNGNANDNGNGNANDNDNDNFGNDGLTGQFAGSERCSLCHANIHFDWSRTLHARAYDTLESIGQQNNQQCLPCHVVGLGQRGGWKDRQTTNALAGVGCESCHGPAKAHADNVNDASLRPPIRISADVCGTCHVGSHHPNFTEWQSSGHARVTADVAEDLIIGGDFVANCGQCHSGDVFYRTVILGEAADPGQFANRTPEQLNGITCVVCHNPHARTGNATEPEDGRDYQLRFKEVVVALPTNTIDGAADPDRFNICGQCHHSRGRTWLSTSRGPHHSVQSNVYIGEMPVPDADQDGRPEPLVQSIGSPHLLAREQCATCHMHRQDFESERAPAIAGHTFQVNFTGCTGAGCHNTSAAQIEQRGVLYQQNVEARLNALLQRLDAWGDWEYSSTGGPMNQGAIPDFIKQVRFLVRYVEADGSRGLHNPNYVNAILEEAERLLTVNGA